MQKDRRITIIGLTALILLAVALSACGGNGNGDGFANREINVVSREDGSGTRGAFIELTGLQVRDAAGNTSDTTTLDAEIAHSTSSVMSGVITNSYAIGYISLGSLNDTVRAVAIDGVMPTVATVQSGTYPLFRAFNLAVPLQTCEIMDDFISFILSAEGQAVAEGRGLVPVNSNSAAFVGAGGLSGTIEVLGSTSVAPVMEHLMEAYEALNPDVTIEVQSAGTSAGIGAARRGEALGMASRELTADELAEAVSITIAFDGLAVIVNSDNPLPNLTVEQIRRVFAGEVTRWGQLHDE